MSKKLQNILYSILGLLIIIFLVFILPKLQSKQAQVQNTKTPILESKVSSKPSEEAIAEPTSLETAIKATADEPVPTESPEEETLSTLFDGIGTEAGVEIVNRFDHDEDCYTQGLIYERGVFYESCGHYGSSRLRIVNPETGEVIKETPLEEKFFAEGIVLLNDKVTVLTWQENTALIYDKDSLEELGRFNYSTDGWGLTTDGKALIMSDGSNKLYWRDPETGFVFKELLVNLNGEPMRNLNELEYVNGEILANVFMTDLILRIDPETGTVLTRIDLTGLMPAKNEQNPGEVLNGIAWDAEGGRLFVTGKFWNVLYEIKIVPANP